jgi:hypothetical protein
MVECQLRTGQTGLPTVTLPQSSDSQISICQFVVWLYFAGSVRAREAAALELGERLATTLFQLSAACIQNDMSMGGECTLGRSP